MTLAEMVAELKMLLRNNRLSDDERMDDRLWEKLIVTQRALWIRNQIVKNSKPQSAVVQDLGCVGITTADPAECCDFNTNCTVLRTSVEVPRRIETPNFDGITRVGPVDKFQIDYLYVPYERARWAGGGYFNGNAIVATELNDYVYLISRSPSDYFKYLSFVNIRGVFEDPRTVGAFTRCTGEACFSADSEYPITEAMWVYMKNQIVESNFGILTSVLSDKKNDADAEVQKS